MYRLFTKNVLKYLINYLQIDANSERDDFYEYMA